MRFVVVATIVRGSLEVPEPLDENGQVLAAARADQEQSSLAHARVHWQDGHDPRKPKRERMSVTADEVAWAREILARANQ